MDADAEPELARDELIEGSLAAAVEALGVDRYLEAPQVSFDERCFPDPWEPSLRGVHTALRRLMRHVRLPDVPVVVEDAREAESEGLLQDPVLFDCIEEGAACFTVVAIGSPRLMVTWLALEVVRAWAEYHGVTGGRASGYREPAPDDAEPPQPASLGDGMATVFGVGLGLGPLFACGTIQTHKSERIVGSFVEARWATQTVGIPPAELTRLLAVHALSRGAGPEELEQLRGALDEDLRRMLDATLAELADDVPRLREALGLPATPTVERAAPDLSPLPAEDDDEALVVAEREHEERRRFFNHGREIHAVIKRRTGMGVAGGMLLWGLLVPLAVKGWMSGTVLAVSSVLCLGVGVAWGRRQTFLRCSDMQCWGRIGPTDATCPACGGTVAGQLRSANDRFANEE